MKNYTNKIKRVNKKGETFKGKFYLIDKSNEDCEWWILRLRSNHFTLSAVSSKEEVFNCITKYIKKYKDYDRFMKAMKKCEREKHNKDSYEKMAKQYLEYKGTDLNIEVEEHITSIEEGRKKKTLGAKFSTVEKKNVTEEKVQPVKEEKKKEVVKTPMIKRKKKKVRILK